MELIRAECPVCGHRYQTYSRLEGRNISCPKCGSLIPVERDWRAPPPSAPPASKSEWSVSGLIKKGFLLLLLGAALFLLLKGEDKALVSFDNGLAVPVHVFIDGKFRRSLSPAEVWNKNLRSDYHSVEIRLIDGKAMERKTIFCDKGYYIYNIARAHQYEIQYHIYVAPEIGHKSLAAPAPQPLKKTLFLQVEADIPLGGKPPAEIELPEGYDNLTLTVVTIKESM